MSNAQHQRHHTGPVLRPHDVQIITGMRRIKVLEETLQAVRDDLEMRADMGTYEGDHSVQLGNSVYYKLCEVTKSKPFENTKTSLVDHVPFVRARIQGLLRWLKR